MIGRNGSNPVGIDLEVVDITVRRGGTPILDGFSLVVRPGRAVGIVGVNGAGKTSVLDAISGTVAVEKGSIRIDGENATEWSPQRRNRMGVRRTFQESHLYPQLTVTETLGVASRTSVRTEERLSSVGLSPSAMTYVSELSTGQRRLLDLVAVTTGPARLLLLDEPTAGLAPDARRQVLEAIRAWRRRTRGTLVVVEHDREALEGVVDDVITLEAPYASARVAPDVGLNGQRASHSEAQRIESVVTGVAATRRPLRRPQPAGPSVWALGRFGLREFAAGMLSVLTLGVLNRVMKVELGIPLLVVAPVLAAYNLAAPVALWIGARSDRRPIRGLHRTPYILGGAVLMAVMAAIAPFAAWRLEAGIGPLSLAIGVGVFAFMGAGMYASGATYFALLAEVVTAGRERAVAVVYSMLMAGILAGVGLSAYVLPSYAPGALLSIHGFVAVVIVVCTWWAVQGAEGRQPAVASAATIRIGSFLQSSQVKRFFVFMLGITFFAFLQQAILEPFGGDAFGLDVRATTSFNGIQIVAVLFGMAIAARAIAPRVGKRMTTVVGGVVGAAGLALVAASGLHASLWLLYSGIVCLGLGLGVLNVGSLSLMLDMTAGHAAGLAMGLWTVGHAVADGVATASGGLLQTVARHVLGGEVSGYAAVFGFEAVGLLAVLVLLRRIDPTQLKEEFDTRRETR